LTDQETLPDIPVAPEPVMAGGAGRRHNRRRERMDSSNGSASES
jgi:hypothetical protein